MIFLKFLHFLILKSIRSNSIVYELLLFFFSMLISNCNFDLGVLYDLMISVLVVLCLGLFVSYYSLLAFVWFEEDRFSFLGKILFWIFTSIFSLLVFYIALIVADQLSFESLVYELRLVNGYQDGDYKPIPPVPFFKQCIYALFLFRKELLLLGGTGWFFILLYK